MTRRINARLDPDLARKIETLRRQTGQSMTEIVKASLESYYVEVTGARRPAELLAELIGSGVGPRDLSVTYKSELTRSLSKKRRA